MSVRVLMDGLSNRYGGGSRYVNALLTALRPHAEAGELEMVVAIAESANDTRAQESKGMQPHVVNGVDSLPSRLVWMQTGMRSLAKEIKADVIFAPGNLGPLYSPVPMVLSLQVTPAASVHAGSSLSKRAWWAAMTEASRRSAHKAAHVLTVSHYLRDWVLSNWKLRADKVTATPYGVGAPFIGAANAVTADASVESPFVLYAGDFQPHKNLLRLVDAFAQVARNHPSLKLVFAGDTSGGLLPGVQQRIALHRLDNRVQMLGRVTAEHLAALYRSAEVVAMPSLAESFGLPVIEALACGAVVLSADIPSLREIGSGATAYFPPTDTDELARALERLLIDEEARQQMKRGGPLRASSYTWATTAQQTLKALHDAAAH
jgi:glycosyltransferase involved in cell wall biosynthesis